MRGLGLVAPLALGLLMSGRAAACGGCFGPPTSPTLVTGHRMAFAISETQTVLWDQFEYQGDPDDFSWVLPVRPGAYVELADDAWLTSLDAFTSTTVIPPRLNCPQAFGDDVSGSGCGCGFGGASDASSTGRVASGGNYEPPVAIVRQETVGPYDTVVLRSTDPEALRTWLTTNGYAIPDEIQPVIDAYVSEGNDFLALRLSPGQGVSQMEPVRVITPGGEYLLPLRMVAAGVGALVDIKLFVIAEQRAMMPDMAEVSVDTSTLSIDYIDGATNYLELREAALAQNGGKSYLTSYARQGALWRDNLNVTQGSSVFYTTSGPAGFSAPTLAGLYFAQAAVDDGTSSFCTKEVPLQDTSLVVDNCTDDGACTPLAAGERSMNDYLCQEHSDLATALVGMHPNKAWVTRLELNLPSTALDVDCIVEPAVAQTEVTVFRTAEVIENPPCDPAKYKASMAVLSADWRGLVSAALTLGALLLRRKGRADGE